MFLKRIEIQGFKSFADRVVINFEHGVTGVVGPNGCGKSNIADAIRWVLGEQSVKSLRGEKMTDVIFSGSANRRAVNMAEVSLIFDNSKHYLNSDVEEIEVTRRLYGGDNEAEYLINKRSVRLKDIHDLIVDSGLGKDSLSMISQGNIVSFAEAKPYERRAIFEEAAGVSKYKKRKIESINKLERTKDNLERTFDMLSELERQVSPLKRQANKAKIYKEKKALLEEIEIAVLVNEISLLNDQRNEIQKILFDLETKIVMHKTSIEVHENNNEEHRRLSKELEKEINSLSDRLMKLVNEIQILEARKIENDEKRKYAIETGSKEDKIKHTKDLLEEARIEYEDRLKRKQELENEIALLSNEYESIALKLVDDNFAKEEAYNKLRKLQNRKEVLENILRDPFSANSQSGVKAIMDNKEHFYGIKGVIGQIFKVDDEYKQAIQSALAASVYHIVTEDEKSARDAIAFLKQNRSGRATFLPLTVLKGHYLSKEARIICEDFDAYRGLASDFVSNDEEFDILAEALLANIIVVDDLKSANELSDLLNHNYKIVTLDGDIINKGGSMTGGRVKNETSILTAQSELDSIKDELISFEADFELLNKEYSKTTAKRDKVDREIYEKRISLASLESLVDTKRAKYEKLKADFELLSPDSSEDENFSDSIITALNEAYLKKDEYTINLKSKKDARNKLLNEMDRKHQQVLAIRKDLDKAQSEEKKLVSQDAAISVKIENDLSRLTSEYKMTYDYALEHFNIKLDSDAKEKVISLRREIEALGNINMEAPEEYEKVNERYEFIKKNYDELIASRDKILNAIEEMDQVMIKQFKDMFDKINAELNNTFTSLFGGGKAKLVLEDPNDILNTGIDIDVQPPGKSVKSIRLFSGGEKTLIAICVLFTILKVRPVPLIVFDEVEAALDQANVERFAKYVKAFEKDSQFIIITHRPGTMEQCDVLYGITMQKQGVSELLKVELVDAVSMAEVKEGD